MDLHYRTKKCFICLSPVEVWSGHFLVGPFRIMAGTCRRHKGEIREGANFMNRQGCLGAWHSAYGLELDED
jgi:hypothetical protein